MRPGLYIAVALTLLSSAAVAQTPIDLFSDVPALGSGSIRVAAWNLRHINLEEGADDFLTGTTETQDFAILIRTFAKRSWTWIST